MRTGPWCDGGLLRPELVTVTASVVCTALSVLRGRVGTKELTFSCGSITRHVCFALWFRRRWLVSFGVVKKGEETDLGS